MLSGNTSQVYAIKNPQVFIYNTNTSFADWYTNSSSYQNNNLWSTIKSSYDPCPAGWRVPQNSTWSDFSAQTAPYYIQGKLNSTEEKHMTNGRLYNMHVWYPASGSLHYITGEHSNVGANGCSWSSSYSGNAAFSMDFYMTNIYYSNINRRANGFPVRCIQE